MSMFFDLKLYRENSNGIDAEGDVKELIANVLKENGLYDESKCEGYEKDPFREVRCDFDDGLIRLRSKFDIDFDVKLDEQLSNEFVIQIEMLNIKNWDPLRYSEAYRAEQNMAWELEYNGIRGRQVVRSGESKYPKEWQILIDIINAFTDDGVTERDSLNLAAEYYSGLLTGEKDRRERIVKALDMVSVLSGMGMPKDVIAAAILHMASLEEGFDQSFVSENYDASIYQLMGLMGDIPDPLYQNDKKGAGHSLEEWRQELIDRVKGSDSLYYKRIVLAGAIAELIAIRDGSSGDGDPGSDERSITKAGEKEDSLESPAVYYAALISALEPLEKDEKSVLQLKRLADLYKDIFVTYKIDSFGGNIYQFSGNAAAVVLKRGEYDWKTDESVSDGAESTGAITVTKDLALFIASLWKRQADEMILRDGNKDGRYDVGDLKALKVAVHKFSDKKDKASKDIVLKVITRMVTEGEQIFTAVRAEAKDILRLESGSIENVNDVPLSFLGIENQDQKTYAALFTSMEEIDELDGNDITGVPVKMVLEFVKEMEHLDGIIIDPFSDPFTLSNEEISDLLTLEKAERIKRDTAS